jgi:hypothetical protein
VGIDGSRLGCQVGLLDVAGQRVCPEKVHTTTDSMDRAVPR